MQSSSAGSVTLHWRCRQRCSLNVFFGGTASLHISERCTRISTSFFLVQVYRRAKPHRPQAPPRMQTVKMEPAHSARWAAMVETNRFGLSCFNQRYTWFFHTAALPRHRECIKYTRISERITEPARARIAGIVALLVQTVHDKERRQHVDLYLWSISETVAWSPRKRLNSGSILYANKPYQQVL